MLRHLFTYLGTYLCIQFPFFHYQIGVKCLYLKTVIIIKKKKGLRC